MPGADYPAIPGDPEGLDVESSTMGRQGLIGGVGMPRINAALPDLATKPRLGLDPRATGATESTEYDLPKIAAASAYAGNAAASEQRKLQWELGEKADANIERDARLTSEDPTLSGRMAAKYDASGRPEMAATLRRMGSPAVPGGSTLPPAPQLPDPQEMLAHVFGMTAAALKRGGHEGTMEELGHHAMTAISAHPQGQMLLEAAHNQQGSGAPPGSIEDQVDALTNTARGGNPYQDKNKLRQQLTKAAAETPEAKFEAARQTQLGHNSGLMDATTGVGPQALARERGVNQGFKEGTDARVDRADRVAAATQGQENKGHKVRRLFDTGQKEIEGRTAADQKLDVAGNEAAIRVAEHESKLGLDATAKPAEAGAKEAAKNSPLAARDIAKKETDLKYAGPIAGAQAAARGARTADDINIDQDRHEANAAVARWHSAPENKNATAADIANEYASALKMAQSRRRAAQPPKAAASAGAAPHGPRIHIDPKDAEQFVRFVRDPANQGHPQLARTKKLLQDAGVPF